jgi:hypothetical protein
MTVSIKNTGTYGRMSNRPFFWPLTVGENTTPKSQAQLPANRARDGCAIFSALADLVLSEQRE